MRKTHREGEGRGGVGRKSPRRPTGLARDAARDRGRRGWRQRRREKGCLGEGATAGGEEGGVKREEKREREREREREDPRASRDLVCTVTWDPVTQPSR